RREQPYRSRCAGPPLPPRSLLYLSISGLVRNEREGGVMADQSGLRFTETHEWVRQEGEAATVGISQYAQSQLGDVIYVELPAVGQKLEAGGRLGVVESVKAASDLYSPVSGDVTAVNDELKDHPEY